MSGTMNIKFKGGDFVKSLDRFQEDFEQKLLEAFKAAVIEVGEELIRRSPVDTGNFANNWITANSKYPSKKRRDKPDPSATAALEELHAVANAMTLQTMRRGVTITNNSPYARVLEWGSSDKAPEGMVRVTEAQWADIFDRAAQKVGLK